MKRAALDPAEIAVLGHALHSVAVEMGAALRRTAFSPNIKERRDYSSAVFSAGGDLIAMGDDMPVHLGSMPMSVRAVLDSLDLAPGDVALLNDPFRGGTHLPDITMVAPVFLSRGGRSPLSTLPTVLTTPTSAECSPAPWACAAKSPRKAFAFLR